MSEYKTKILLGLVVAVIIAAGLTVAALTVSPQLGGTQSTTNLSSGTSQQQQSTGLSSTQQVSSASGFGALNIYLTDAPPQSPQFSYLLVNVSSMTIRYGDSTTCDPSTPSDYVYNIPSAVGMNVNLTNLSGGKSASLGTAKAPTGSVSEVIFNITGAKAFFSDRNSSQLKVVADGKLMVPIHFQIGSTGSADLTVDITPNSIHISNGNQQVLTPVVHLTVVDHDQSSTSTSTTVASAVVSATSTISASTSLTSATTSSTTSCSTSPTTSESESAAATISSTTAASTTSK